MYGLSAGEDPVIAALTGSEGGVRVAHDTCARLLRVTLANPPGNRLGLAQVERLHDIAGRLRALDAGADACRVVVLDAEGADFSHGANLSDPELSARLVAGREAQIAFARCGQALVSRWREIPVPTIAVATGHVVGAGACLFLASDFRVADATMRVRFPEIDRAMHLGWGIVPRLVALLGEARALRLAVLAEPLDGGALADVVTLAGDPAGETMQLAARLAGKPPLAVRAILRVLREAQRVSDTSAGRDAEAWADTLASADFGEAMAAFYARRAAVWTGR